MEIEPSSVALAAAVAVAAGVVGCFAVMRRMTLAADALSHVALPGIGMALALRVHPFFGALAMLVLGSLLIWSVERRTRIATETIIGVVFSAALAVGSVTSVREDLIDALFGGPGVLTLPELVVGAAASAAVVAFVLANRHRLVLMVVSPEIAHTSGVRVPQLDLLFLLTFAITVALGLRFLGVLLMGSLLIIPAATARRLARGLRGMLAIAVAVAVAATVLGTWTGATLHRETGPFIVMDAAACFLLSLLVPRRA